MDLSEIEKEIVEKSPEDEKSLHELDTIPMDFIDKRLEDLKYVKNLIEAILLVASEPVDLDRISKSLGIKRAIVNEAVEILISDYSESGIVVRCIAGGLELCTHPDLAVHIERFFQMEHKRHVSRAALQTLSIIAYNQPITRAEIESFRGGINSEGVLQSLLERDLIKIAGKKETPGTPYLYAVSEEFLKYFGLNDIDELKRRLPAISMEITDDGGVAQLKLRDLGMKTGASDVKGDNEDSEDENEAPSKQFQIQSQPSESSEKVHSDS